MTDDARRNAWPGRTRSGGLTPWETMSIVEILGIIASMDEGSAHGDAQAVLTAIDSVEAIARTLQTGFSADGVLMGRAAQGAVDAAQRLGAEMSQSAGEARTGAGALSEAAGILGAAHGQEPLLRLYQQRLQDHPEDAAQVRSQVRGIMSGTYGTPMVTAAAALPEPAHPVGDDAFGAASPGGFGGGGPGGGGAAPSGAHPQSAALTDIDGTGPGGGPPGGPGGGGDVPVAPAPNAAVPAGAQVPTTGGPNPGPPGPGGGDPSRLNRGGLGAPVGTVPATPAGGRGRGAGDGTGSPGSPGSPGSNLPEGVIGLPPTTFAPSATIVSSPGPGVPGGPPTGTPAGGARPAPAPGPGGAGPHSRDTRHRPAHYLQDGENGREIVGDLPLVGPPVIGDWSPQALPTTVDDSGFGAVAVPASGREPVPAVDDGQTGSPQSDPPER
ncbi:hypothetical protein ACLQ3C_10535 [Gordonia sp. DT30]|uniref:hypothetical protein n=1 Tax=unclassified Gordonia (in: high G+C Gram-positive bacteria) TaxID=2657482 RepID=UPI003CF90567